MSSRESGDSSVARSTHARSLSAQLAGGFSGLTVVVLTGLIAILTLFAAAVDRHAGTPASGQRVLLIAATCTGAAVLIVVVLTGQRFHRRLRSSVVGPVEDILETMRTIRDGDLSARALGDGPVELRQIASGLNEMTAVLGRERVLLQAREQELRGQAVALQEARREAEVASEAKSEFLSRMSHELRTPLNAILGFAELLTLEGVDPAVEEGLSHVSRAGRHLLDLINDVLDIARIESGRVPMTLESLSVAEVVAHAVELVGPLAAARDIELGTEAVGADLWVLADRQRLQQVLLNLLSNAIKYNRDGGRVTVHLGDGADGRVRIEVEDTGRGIRASHIPRLFQSFERLDAASTGIEGTGLGLALSASLTAAMAGQLDVQSEPGVGSRFALELPRGERVLREAAAAPDRPVVRLVDPRRTVLYIEDALSDVQLITMILARRPGLELMSAIQGRLGLELAREHLPDLILLDVHLPDIGGAEVLERLRADPATAAIPVLIVSADAGSRTRDRFLARGARGYLTKPLAVANVLEVIDECLRLPTAAQAMRVATG